MNIAGRPPHSLPLTMFWFVALGSVVGLLYGLAQSTDRWHTALSGLVIALASAAVGGILGLLFGLPKRSAPAAAPAPPPAPGAPGGAPAAAPASPNGTPLPYVGSTNLEQVADWLTKILLGAGLTQIVHLPSAFQHLGTYLAPSIGKDSAAVFAAALVVFNLLAGFFYAFLGARILLPRVLTDAETKVAQTKSKLYQLPPDRDGAEIDTPDYTTGRTARQHAIQLYQWVEQLERHTPGISFSSDEYRRLAQQLVKVKRPVTAVNLLHLAMRYHPDDARLPLLAGVTYGRELNQYDEAERSYYDALHLDPDYDLAYYDLACNYARRYAKERASTTPGERQRAPISLGQVASLLTHVKAAYPDLFAKIGEDHVWDEVDLRADLVGEGLLPPPPAPAAPAPAPGTPPPAAPAPPAAAPGAPAPPPPPAPPPQAPTT